MTDQNYKKACLEDFNGVLDIVCWEFGIDRNQLYAKTQKREVAQVRHLCMWIARNRYNNKKRQFSWNACGDLFSKDRGTAMHAANRVIPNLLDTDMGFKMKCKNIYSKLPAFKFKVKTPRPERDWNVIFKKIYSTIRKALLSFNGKALTEEIKAELYKKIIMEHGPLIRADIRRQIKEKEIDIIRIDITNEILNSKQPTGNKLDHMLKYCSDDLTLKVRDAIAKNSPDLPELKIKARVEYLYSKMELYSNEIKELERKL